MHTHQINSEDQILIDAIENYRLKVADFNHATHVRLAYGYLVKMGHDAGLAQMQKTLQKFLSFNGVDPQKFHVTLTHAWIKAVWHFMLKTPAVNGAAEFIKINPVLLNKDLLASHYSHDLLFSDRARKKFIEPDLSPFPEV